MSLIVDAYLSSDADDYIDRINRPILHLKTIAGGELRAEVCSRRLKDYMNWVTDDALKRKIDTINALFRNCPESECAVRDLADRVAKL